MALANGGCNTPTPSTLHNPKVAKISHRNQLAQHLQEYKGRNSQ